MTYLQRLMMLHRLQDKAGEGGDPGPGAAPKGGQSDDPDKKAVDEKTEPNPDEKNEPDPDPDAGKHKPTDEEAKLLKDVMAKKRENERLKQEKADLEKRFEGIDPEEVRKILKERNDEATRKLEEKGEWDRLKKQMTDSFDVERTRLATEKDALATEKENLQRQIGELTVGGAFQRSEFIQNEMTMTPAKARIVYGPHFEFKDGKVIAYDKPAGAADRTQLIDSTGEPLSFEAAIKVIFDADPESDSLRRSKMKPGANSKTTLDTKKPTKPSVELDSHEKVRLGIGALLGQ